eukprot:CAMPEP_0182465418 /NCGR_PEP_ID=MMETSP1319-20130603/9720_1 /TAXON_ID=172717 /ORGANISM="Bolidomonas pacifica, Strain RCC208" /LENGTH=168 /DNA_ID=CAMNT_0024665165 /DNA_START=139 /DNA_END=642 /DNA_ORIENTATION=+
MSTLLGRTSSSSSPLQALSAVRHVSHITDLLSLLITLRSLDKVPDDLYETILQISELDSTYTKQDWDKVLTLRQRSLPTLAPSSQTFFESLPPPPPPATPYSDTKLYKSLLLSWSSSSSRPLLRAAQKGQKKKVNRKASKGRKVKYVRMKEVEDFMFPVERGGGEDRW